MSGQCLSTRQVGPVLWIILDNPPVNFLTTDIMADLHLLIRQAEQDDSVRAIVLTGNQPGRYIFHFSIPEIEQISRDADRLRLGTLFRGRLSGAFMRWHNTLGLRLMQHCPAYQRVQLAVTRRLRRWVPTLYSASQVAATSLAIENCRKPTIAAINGTCNGGGTELSACFDFRFMIEDGGYTIGQPEVLIGIIAGAGGTQRVTRLLGKARALELMLTGDQWSAQQAQQYGLITGHFPAQVFVERVQAFAERLARRHLGAYTATREAVAEGLSLPLVKGLSVEMQGFVTCCDTPDTRAAMAHYGAFLASEVLGKPEQPATMPEILQHLESEEFTRHFTHTPPAA
jgi:enoyl-CoA hydratase/carnithine racemase